MAFQSVLLPTDSSLFITDKSWLRLGKTLGPGQGTFKLGHTSEIDGLSVTVVKTGIKSGRTGSKASRKAEDVSQSRGLQFVNTTQTKQGKRDQAELRRLVRSHVMTGTKRRAPQKSTKAQESAQHDQEFLEALITTTDESYDEEIFSPHSTSSWPSSTSSSMTLIPSNTSTPLYGKTSFPIHPHYHRFMNYYTIKTASQLYPLEAYFGFNPVKTFWFPVGLTDEVLLHTMMYCAAVSLSQADPSLDTKDLHQLVGPILRLLACRLESPATINDASIGAVSCLVMVENLAGESEKSLVHMKGLKQMIKARGGLETIDEGLVMKIIRADMERSVDNLMRPVLPPLERLVPTLYMTLPASARRTPQKAVQELMRCADLRLQLKAALLELSDFTSAVQYYTSQGDHLIEVISPRSFDEDLLSIERNLLETSDLTVLEEVVQIATLIFAKSIRRGLPFAASAPQVLPKRLRQALSLLLVGNVVPFSTDMLLWLLFMGGLASKAGGREEIWFVDELVKMRNVDYLFEDGEGVRPMLKEMLFVDVVHSEPCQKLWKQVWRIWDMKRRWDKQVETGMKLSHCQTL